MLSILYGIAKPFIRLPNLSFLQPSSVIVSQNSFEIRWLQSEYYDAGRPDLALRAIPATVTLYVSEPKEEDDCLSPPFRPMCESYMGYRNGTMAISATVYGGGNLPKMLRSGPMNLFYTEGESWTIDASCVPDISQGCTSTRTRFSAVTILQELQWFYQNSVTVSGDYTSFELYRVVIGGEWEQYVPGLPVIPCAECIDVEDPEAPIKFVECSNGKCQPVTIGYNEYGIYIPDPGCDMVPELPSIPELCPPGSQFIAFNLPCEFDTCPPGYRLESGLCVRDSDLPLCPPGYVREGDDCIPFDDDPTPPPPYPDNDIPAPPGYDPYPPGVIPYPCPSGTYWDGTQCRARGIPCPPGTTWNGTGCAPFSCPPGYIYVYGRCENDVLCPDGRLLLNGECVDKQCGPCEDLVAGKCKQKYCPGATVLNPSDCSCECPPCPDECTVSNDVYCTCDCDPSPFPGCPPDKCFDGRFCVECDGVCPPNSIPVDGECIPLCGECEVLNEDFECEQPPCPIGYFYCGDCTCCPESICPPGFHPCGDLCCPPEPNPEFPCPPDTRYVDGRCIQTPCTPGPGEYYDSILNECVCLPCKYGLASTPTCGCEGSPCPPGVGYDASIGRCECPPGQEFNGQGCAPPPGDPRELPDPTDVCTTWTHKYVYADPQGCVTREGVIAVTNDNIDAGRGAEYAGFWCGWNHYYGFYDTQGRLWNCTPYCAFAGGFKFKSRWCRNGNPCTYGCRMLKLVFVEPFIYSFDWENYRLGTRRFINLLFPQLIREFSIPAVSCASWDIVEKNFGLLGKRIYYSDIFGEEYLGTVSNIPFFPSQYLLLESSFCAGCTNPCSSDSDQNGWTYFVQF